MMDSGSTAGTGIVKEVDYCYNVSIMGGAYFGIHCIGTGPGSKDSSDYGGMGGYC